MSSYSGNRLLFFPIDNFTIYGGPSRLHLCRTVHDGLKSSPIRRRLRAVLATDDPREQKTSAAKYATLIRNYGNNIAKI